MKKRSTLKRAIRSAKVSPKRRHARKSAWKQLTDRLRKAF